MHNLLMRLRLFLRYNVSSILTFALELLVLYALVQEFLLAYYLAVPISFALTTTAQWIMCHWWVFKRSGRRMPVEYAYFWTILISGLVWATIFVSIFVQLFGLDVYIARILASPLTGLWDFYLNARFNFHTPLFGYRGRAH